MIGSTLSLDPSQEFVPPSVVCFLSQAATNVQATSLLLSVAANGMLGRAGRTHASRSSTALGALPLGQCRACGVVLAHRKPLAAYASARRPRRLRRTRVAQRSSGTCSACCAAQPDSLRAPLMRRSPPYQLVASLPLALSGAAARPRRIRAAHFQSRRRLMRHQIDQSRNTPRLARSSQRPVVIVWSPVRIRSGLLPAALARQSCRACPTSLATLARLGWLLGMTTSRL